MQHNLRFKYGIAVFLLFSTPTMAATLHTLNDLQTIDIAIAEEGLTRIVVKGDRILCLWDKW